MSRLSRVDEHSNPELAATYQRIVETRGYVSNILMSYAHAPDGLRCFAALGEYVRYRTELPARLREFAILAIARGIQYAWTHHVPAALKAGITQAELDAFNAGAFPPTISAAERAAVAYAREFANLGRVSDATFGELRRHLSERQVTDLTLLCGYFIALGCTINAFRVELEDDRKPLMRPVA